MAIFNAIRPDEKAPNNYKRSALDYSDAQLSFWTLLKLCLGTKREAGFLLCLVATLLTLSTVCLLLAPLLTARLIDHIQDLSLQNLLILLAFIAVCYLAHATLSYLGQVRLECFLIDRGKALRQKSLAVLLRVPFSVLDQAKISDSVQRLTIDVEAMVEGYKQLLLQVFQGLPLLVFSMCILFCLHWGLALLTFLLLPLCYLISRQVARKTKTQYQRQSRIQVQVDALIEESLSEKDLIQVSQAESERLAQFQTYNRHLQKEGQRAQFFSSLANPSTRFLNNLIFILLLVVSSYEVLRGHLSIGLMSLVLQFSVQLSKPINELSGVWAQVQAGVVSSRRLCALMKLPQEGQEGATNVSVRDRVEIDGLNFGYEAGKTILRDLNLCLEAGQRIALVGASGSGKTTLIQLLLRFYEVGHGQIRLDGESLNQLNLACLRRRIGVVFQETYFFEGSIHDNLAYGCTSASREEVEEAAQKALAHHFILQLPQGYDTPISVALAELSEGQKQMLSLARLFLCDVDMLILDEASSSLDSVSERQIQASMERLMEGKICLIIAHRLSTIQSADKIYYLEDGKVLEQGTHQTLLEENGAYAKLYRAQFET